MYQIQSKSDLQNGVTLVVSIPEEELDKKALYTILAEQPGFILPFRQRVVDGKAEFIYQIGNRTKITYLSGWRNPREYVELWSGILHPLLYCKDWFLNPYSFVLTPEHLYCDKDGKTISFVYIPSIRTCSDYQTLKELVAEIAKHNPVSDVTLENQVWRALQEFNPNEFLNMLKSGKFSADSTPGIPPAPAAQQAPIPPAAPPEPKQVAYQAPLAAVPPAAPLVPNLPRRSDDLEINLSAERKAPKKPKSSGGMFGAKKEKKEKVKPAPKEKPQKAQKKEKKEIQQPQQQAILQGAAAMPPNIPFSPAAAAPGQQRQPVSYVPQSPAYDDGMTQLEGQGVSGMRFRYTGNQNHPRAIPVTFAGSAFFTIGRFDASVGKQQSDFEFDRATKAISRRHAVVEQNAGGYFLIDLSSSAGTFINGQRLMPNAPYLLEPGSRISFGNAGAEYIWEM